MTLKQDLRSLLGVVEEITYETDLLAMEAARSDARRFKRMRRQARMAADAARETKGLIRQTAFQLRCGRLADGSIDQALARIAEQAAVMETLVAELAAA